MSISKEARWKSLHDEMMQAFNRSYPSQSEVRLQCLQDRRFVSVPSAQWEGNLQQQFANRPRFEINKIANAVQRIFCEYRNNRISVDFRPEDGATDENAELLDGLYRADEQKCNAQEAYDNAFDEGVSGGFGAWRLCYDYEYPEDEDDERQRIRMEPIYDADSSVFFDIDAKRQDKADAKMCWVISSMSRYEYEEKYGAMGSSFDQVETLGMFDWFSPDVVKIAEYYVVRRKKKTYNIYRLEITGDEERLEESDDEAAAELIAQGYILARQKRIEQEYVQKYIVDGSRVLEDCGRIAGKCIPVVPFYGKRAYIDNVERIQGHVRLTTDTMRLYNMLISMLAEIATYNWIEKPILTPEQIQGHEFTWANDNLARNPYLLLNPITGPNGEQQAAGPVGYTKPPTIPQALAALIQLVGADMQELLGAQDKGEEIVSNISAKAIELIQTRLDMQTFIYMDNMAKAMRRCGVVWLHMAKDLYNEEKRKMKTIAHDGSEDSVELMRPIATDDGIAYENDLSGRFDVNVDVGPSFTSRRDGTVRTLAGLMNLTQDPAERSTLMGVILNNIDGEGLDGLKEYNRSKLIRQGIVKPTDEEAAALQEEAANQKPDPQAQYLIAEAGKQEALAVKAKADTMAAVADSEKTQAETAKLIAETSGAKLDQIIKAIEALQMAANPNKREIEEVVA